MKTFLLCVFLGIITGCSVTQPENRWAYAASEGYEKFERYFLEDNRPMAKSEFAYAERQARQSADLDNLARLYLGYCALQSAVLAPQCCDAYHDISAVAGNAHLDAYAAMIEGTLAPEQVELLPKRYRELAGAIASHDHERLDALVNDMDDLVARMVGASLARPYLRESTLESLIAEASHFGYKRAVTGWMRHLADITENAGKKALLEQKITIMEKGK